MVTFGISVVDWNSVSLSVLVLMLGVTSPSVVVASVLSSSILWLSDSISPASGGAKNSKIIIE